jgi:DNA-directed RNA polymerase specialized sigma24 family protein
MIQRPERARAEVFTRYRTPVFNFLRNRGLSEHDAEDVAQDVFLRVCREDFLKKLDRNRGKFRSLLLAVTRHVMLNERASRHRKEREEVRCVRRTSRWGA